jgi:hypothetical protein
MSSPRGLFAGGIGAIGAGALEGRGVGDGARDWVDRWKMKGKGLMENVERRGGRRTFRYMLKFRRALFA